MERKEIPFKKILEFFESKNWALKSFWGHYRVFLDLSGKEKLPYLILVRDGQVSIEYWNKMQEYFREKEEEDEDEENEDEDGEDEKENS